ncbi:hypothetical protein L484_000312 [Morus notabilis]|uniref:Uncharacterized protein n=1 Tax=Morus notabilis TaxID=981085 RepID=W9SPV8_9ROSA|nr:hypothetical protein L484_011951 [Morus notabilis]EXC52912.1 hypothetical protein L484_000312 [Morus notabilis]
MFIEGALRKTAGDGKEEEEKKKAVDRRGEMSNALQWKDDHKEEGPMKGPWTAEKSRGEVRRAMSSWTADGLFFLLFFSISSGNRQNGKMEDRKETLVG